MFCPRLNHFRRIMPDGKIGVCGHMMNGPTAQTLEDLEGNSALLSIKDHFNNSTWPKECVRCQQEESLGQTSIRQHAIQRDKILKHVRPDYLIVGGILDNICNAACQFCSANLSTKIGSLSGPDYKIVNNVDAFKSLPQDRIIELDINGGEPSNSPNYLALLDDLPSNVKIVRVNTNASKFIKPLPKILAKGIKVIITMSLDGTDKIYEYARWPLRWPVFNETVMRYKEISEKDSQLSLDFWTTVSAYTVGNLDEIRQYSEQVGIPVSMGRLKHPSALDVYYSNPLTRQAAHVQDVAVGPDNSDELLNYIKEQDKLRGTNYENCYHWS